MRKPSKKQRLAAAILLQLAIGGLMLQYDGKFIPYKKYVPGLVTKLNFNTAMDYNGRMPAKH